MKIFYPGPAVAHEHHAIPQTFLKDNVAVVPGENDIPKEIADRLVACGAMALGPVFCDLCATKATAKAAPSPPPPPPSGGSVGAGQSAEKK